MERLSTAGRICFALAVAASGLMQIVNADFVRLVSQPAGWIPEPRVCAVAGGVVLLLVGAALLTDARRRLAALVLAGLLLVVFVLRGPEIAANPTAGYVWTNPAKVLALLCGALLLAGEPASAGIVASGLLGIFLLICGGQHYVYAGFVDTLVPGWIPPSQRFWTLFTGTALLLGGAGVLVPATRRLAGLLSGAMILLWVLLLHLPRSVEMKSAFELAGVFEALAIGGVAWLVAGTGRALRTEPVDHRAP